MQSNSKLLNRSQYLDISDRSDAILNIQIKGPSCFNADNSVVKYDIVEELEREALDC
jgi:hypothetical protein